MARGKAAAQAANRRLTEVQDRVTALERQLLEREVAYRAEVNGLRAALRRAEGAISREIRQLSDSHVAAERDRANAAVKAARDGHLEQVIAGFVLLESLPSVTLEATMDQWGDIGEAFGVDVGPLMAGIETAQHGRPHSRHTARTSNSSARWKGRIVEGIGRGDMYNPGNAVAHKSDRWREA